MNNKQRARELRAAKKTGKKSLALAKEVAGVVDVGPPVVEVVRASDLSPDLGPQGITINASTEVIQPVKGKSPKRKLEPKKIELVPAPSGAPVNKRITPGAHVDEWRIARSLRIGKPGFFLQGGYVEKKHGRKFFRVAEEEYFKSLHDAKKAHVAKLPVAAEVGESVEVTGAPVESHVN